MNRDNKVKIALLPTGVPGLDDILGGGLAEYSFNIIAGAPGCGKTTLAHQFVFANATAERPALYFTVLGEPALKMLRYQQQFDFYDPSKLNVAVRFINLSEVLMSRGLEGIIEEISKEVASAKPGIVAVDSFRSVLRNVADTNCHGEMTAQSFVQSLGLLLAGWETTSFLIGEYGTDEIHDNPVFTVADGLFWLYQNVERNSIVRQIQIMKMRGQATVPGLHTIRITNGGVRAFSRTLGLSPREVKPRKAAKRLSIGIEILDEMLGGGIPEGDSLLIAGSSGTGKSLVTTEFIAAGIRAGEPGIILIFEERVEEYVRRAGSFGIDLVTPVREGKLKLIYLRPLDLSVDEVMHAVLEAIAEIGAMRLAIDSLSGFEIALATGFRADFRESLYRMIFSLTGLGVTILSTLEIEESFTKLLFTKFSISFLCDDIIRLRYVEIDGQMRKIVMVIKMRGGDHSKDIREYEITREGLLIGQRPTGYERLTTGIPRSDGHIGAHDLSTLSLMAATAPDKAGTPE